VRRTPANSPGDRDTRRSAPPAGAVIARRKPGATLAVRKVDRNSDRPRNVQRPKNLRNRPGAPVKRKQEEELYEEEKIGGEDRNDELIRYLLNEHDKNHGSKPFDPIAFSKDQLLAWTDNQLPPLAGTAPAKMLERHLEGATTHRAEYAPSMTMNPNMQDAWRVMRGELVKLDNEERLKYTMANANAKRKEKWREEAAQDLGLNPADKLEFAEIPKELQQQTTKRVVAGEYDLTSKSGTTQDEIVSNGILKHLQSQPSYKPKDIARFLNTVDGLLEGKPRPVAPQLEIRR
jgi:hypothetical protein